MFYIEASFCLSIVASHRMDLGPLALTDVYYIYIECKEELLIV